MVPLSALLRVALTRYRYRVPSPFPGRSYPQEVFDFAAFSYCIDTERYYFVHGINDVIIVDSVIISITYRTVTIEIARAALLFVTSIMRMGEEEEAISHSLPPFTNESSVEMRDGLALASSRFLAVMPFLAH